MQTPFFLEVRNLTKKFGDVVAAHDVCFDVRQGEVLTLLGPSGCGKTTTLRMIAGFEMPDRGDVKVGGKTIASTRRRLFLPPEKREMGMVFQSYAVWPHMNVFENVAYPLRLRRVKGRQIRQRVEEVLGLVGLAGLEHRSAMLLSGGQQQRVALARALIYSPKILLLDEPLSNLDAILREQMRLELKVLQRQLSITVVFVTHDQVEAMTLSDQLAVMKEGRIEQLGSVQEVYERPQSRFVQEFIGRVIRLEGEVVGVDREGVLVGLSSHESTRVQCTLGGMGLRKGDPVVVAIRPEEVGIETDNGGAGLNQVPCLVETAVFLGDHFECHLRCGEADFTLLTSRADPLFPGQKVCLRLSPRSAHVWHRSELSANNA
ncbi:MAG: ABC transporter ATP-binding protein [Candidatus Binatia bacterium]